MAYRVFISYNSGDKTIANEFASKIKRIGADVWFDKWQGSVELKATVESALRNSDEVLILLTEKAASNPWASFEFGAAAALGKKITPIIIDIDEKDLPAPIRTRQHIAASNFHIYLNELSSRVLQAEEGKSAAG
jgi:hypothetical protein